MRVPGIGKRGLRSGQAHIRKRAHSGDWTTEPELLPLQAAISRGMQLTKEGFEVEVLPREPEEPADDTRGV